LQVTLGPMVLTLSLVVLALPVVVLALTIVESRHIRLPFNLLRKHVRMFDIQLLVVEGYLPSEE